MATARSPKGTYIRHGGDWFLSRAAIGGLFYRSSVGSLAGIDLFNNAVDGSNLHIYKMWVTNDAGFVWTATRQSGHLSQDGGPCSPVIAQGAALPGHLYFDDLSNVPYPPPSPTNLAGYISAIDDAGEVSSIEAPGPLCVLIPGTSLRVTYNYQAVGSATNLAVTFYYLALKDIG